MSLTKPSTHSIHFTHNRVEHLTSQEQKLASTIATHWINFAHSGTPAPDFPEYKAGSSEKVMVYRHEGAKVEEDSIFKGEEMAFWDGVWEDEKKAAAKM
jgi:carboxylesterase type B